MIQQSFTYTWISLGINQQIESVKRQYYKDGKICRSKFEKDEMVFINTTEFSCFDSFIEFVKEVNNILNPKP